MILHENNINDNVNVNIYQKTQIRNDMPVPVSELLSGELIKI